MRIVIVAEDVAFRDEVVRASREAGHLPEILEAGAIPDNPPDVILVRADQDGLDARIEQLHLALPGATIVLAADPTTARSVQAPIDHLWVEPLRERELEAQLSMIEHQRTVPRLEGLLTTAVEAAGDIIEISDRNTVLRYVNPAYTRLLGYERDEALGQPPANMIRNGIYDIFHFAEIERSLAGGKPWSGLLTSRTKDGRTLHLEATVAPVLGKNGELTNSVAVKRDITDRLKKEQEIREANEKLAEARDAALGANRAKSQFLANMSHELRTPLNAIIGYSEMLAEEATDMGEEDFVRDLTRIKTAGQHLLSLISDVLDISKIEAGRMDLYLEDFEVRETLDSVVSTVRHLFADSGNELVIEFDDNLGQMRADLTKVRQVLLNLLSNANKFTDKGKITFRAQRDTREGRDFFCLEVEDTGLGMTREQQDRLFRPFVQADASTTRKFGGTGLGLAISNHFCRMMEGTILLDSTPGKGSRFTIVLPAEVRSPDEREEEIEPSDFTERSSKPPAAHGSPSSPPDGLIRTALVIDPNPDVHHGLNRALAARGLSVENVMVCSEAVEMTKAVSPHVIVVHAHTRGVNGGTVFAELKTESTTRSIPMVVLASSGKDPIGFPIGATDYLIEPVSEEQILEVFLTHIKKTSGSIMLMGVRHACRDAIHRVADGQGHAVRVTENAREARKMAQAGPPDLVFTEFDGEALEVLEDVREDPRLSAIPVLAITEPTLSRERSEHIEKAVRRAIRKADYDRESVMDRVADEVCRLAGVPAGSFQG